MPRFCCLRRSGAAGGLSPPPRSKLTGFLSRRNTASHRTSGHPGAGRSPSARRAARGGMACPSDGSLSSLPRDRKNRRATGTPASQQIIPTLALSKSGRRVEVDDFLSACSTSSPLGIHFSLPIISPAPALSTTFPTKSPFTGSPAGSGPRWTWPGRTCPWGTSETHATCPSTPPDGRAPPPSPAGPAGAPSRTGGSRCCPPESG